MPSREEIVKWLRMAGRDAEQHMPFANELWDDMAKQVEGMRCETCKHCDVEYLLCTINGDSEGIVPEDFGCFSHEPEENK